MLYYKMSSRSSSKVSSSKDDDSLVSELDPKTYKRDRLVRIAVDKFKKLPWDNAHDRFSSLGSVSSTDSEPGDSPDEALDTQGNFVSVNTQHPLRSSKDDDSLVWDLDPKTYKRDRLVRKAVDKFKKTKGRLSKKKRKPTKKKPSKKKRKPTKKKPAKKKNKPTKKKRKTTRRRRY